jgi:2-oxoglutarate ferredoxin oxidoreductase subunit beta
VDYTFNPLSLALGADATFVARALDRDGKHLQSMIKRAAEHKGLAFLEIYQNCVIFNDGAFDKLTDKKTKEDNVLYLEHGKPMIFGVNKDKGIVMDGNKPAIVEIGQGKHRIEDIILHDEFSDSYIISTMLSHMTDDPSMPTPVGVFRQFSKSTYDEGVQEQIDTIRKKKGDGDLEKVLFDANTWSVN